MERGATHIERRPWRRQYFGMRRHLLYLKIILFAFVQTWKTHRNRTKVNNRSEYPNGVSYIAFLFSFEAATTAAPLSITQRCAESNASECVHRRQVTWMKMRSQRFSFPHFFSFGFFAICEQRFGAGKWSDSQRWLPINFNYRFHKPKPCNLLSTNFVRIFLRSLWMQNWCFTYFWRWSKKKLIRKL